MKNVIPPDQLERERALDSTQSFIVQAPAGSGKTELLVQRFLALLSSVKTPDEILAITFTRKSANEMRERIINALKMARGTQNEPDISHKKRTWTIAKRALSQDKKLNWNLIENPNQLRIQTIDSLCTYLTQQLPLLSHLGSKPLIASHAEFLYQHAVKEILIQLEENSEWSLAVEKILLHLDNDLNKLVNLLVNLLRKRDQWLPYIQLNLKETEVRKLLENHLGLVITAHLEKLQGYFPKDKILELLSIAHFAANNLAIANIDSPILALKSLTELPTTKPMDKHKWQGLAQLLLTKNFTWRKRMDADIGFPSLSGIKNSQEKLEHHAFRQKLISFIQSLNSCEELRNALKEISFLPEPNYDDIQWEMLKALLFILRLVIAQLRVTFQQHGQIDFVENAQAALSALGHEDNPTDLALTLDYQIRHILVDEFQDTSHSQCQLLEKLTLGWEENDGRTLFVVGDPMQSIYRFREAEVGIFLRMRQKGIGHVKLNPLTLTVNFRSTPAIVDWNNQNFSQIFPKEDEISTGAVSYCWSTSAHSTSVCAKQTTVELRGMLSDDDRTQAENIVSLILTIKQNQPHEKIAILVRSRSHLANIIPALKQAKINYQAVEIDLLASRQFIQDLLSLTCALAHPSDRIAWLAILRAPWCGLSLSDLVLLAGPGSYVSFLEQLEKKSLIDCLSADAKTRLARILPILTTQIAARGRYDLRSWVESTWLLLGGPACLNDETEMDDVNTFFKLLETFSQKNEVIDLKKLKDEVNHLYAATKHDETLQIMTIHTAKGLEFDTVILPHLERKNAADDKSLLLWMEQPLLSGQLALLLAPIPAIGQGKDTIYEYIYRQQQIKLQNESDRLFYVATTRAKKNLYLFFNTNQTDTDDVKIETGSFLGKIWPFIKESKITWQSSLTGNINDPAKSSNPIPQRFIKRLHVDWKNPLECPKSTIATHQKQTGFQPTNPRPKILGTIFHLILQQISLSGIAWWQQLSNAEQSNYIKQHLMRAGLVLDLDSAVKTVQHHIQTMLADPRGKWILLPHNEAYSEFAISVVIDNKIENLIIDRTFVDKEGVRWIIDYKTSMYIPNDLDAFLKNEQQKYLEQMQKYGRAMKLMSDHSIRFGLFFSNLPAWKEWEFDHTAR